MKRSRGRRKKDLEFVVSGADREECLKKEEVKSNNATEVKLSIEQHLLDPAAL